jgi:hypothetical protein
MPDYTNANLFPYPLPADDPDVPDDMKNLAQLVDKRVVGVYTDASDRDTKTGPVVEEGMVAYLKNDDKLYVRTATAWALYPTPPPTITSGTTVPANTSGANGDIFYKTS